MPELIAIIPIAFLLLIGVIASLVFAVASLPGEASIAGSTIVAYVSTWISARMASRHIRRGLSAGRFFGPIAGLAACYAAWIHNAQVEIHSSDGFSWTLIAVIFVGWSLIAASAVCPLVAAISGLLDRARRPAV